MLSWVNAVEVANCWICSASIIVTKIQSTFLIMKVKIEGIMNVNITTELVKALIIEQFPWLEHLEIKPVETSGHDNRTFHLGEALLIRLSSAEPYALKVPKEQEWLPKLAPYLSLAIPHPIAMGQPSNDYPWHWSIYKWIEGSSINTLYTNDLDLECIATELVRFLKELHMIDTSDANDLLPGQHNWWRGDHVSVYDEQARTQIIDLQGIIDTEAALTLWEEAISSKWHKTPVFIHGDLAVGNIIIKNRRPTAIIDFGGMGIGDPACDLVIAWTFLNGASRKIFKSQMDLDHNTWNRARGWALWKACFELTQLENRTSTKQQQIINEVINDINF